MPSRRFLPILSVAAVLAGAGLFTLVAHTRAPRRPNVVVILVDTLRADHLPAYGYARDTAPFLQTLAAEGVVFENAWSTSSWTAPATASLFTSLHPQQHGVVHGLDRNTTDGRRLVNRIPAAVETLAEMFKDAGYLTLGVSDNAHVSRETGFDQGFDEFESATGATAERLHKWVRDHRPRMAKQPYFLYVHYVEPHEPYLPREPWYSQYARDGRAHPTHAKFVDAYDSEIRSLDDGLGRLYRACGWSEDTVVIVTSDHGEEFGDHGGGGHAHSLYSEVLRVPLVVHGVPGAVPHRVDEPVSLIDVMPTLRELIGRPADARAEGLSLLGLLRGGGQGFDRPLFAHLVQFETGRIWEATIEGEWKRLRLRPGAPQLYNLADDPQEAHDLSETLPSVAAALDRRGSALAARMPVLPAAVDTAVSPQTAESLRALGYAR
ncbi:MAG: sulfatase [Vicinamibacteria bacterium]